MSSLVNLLRRMAGRTPSRQVDSAILALFQPGDRVDAQVLADQHNAVCRALERDRITIESLVTSVRDLIGELEDVKGKPNTIHGSPLHQQILHLEARVIELEKPTPIREVTNHA
jgi:hypothetical protein